MQFTEQKYLQGEYCAQHLNPVWRDKSDFILLAFLERKDNHNHWEQLFAKKISDNIYYLCCVPFFTYGLNLGDEVECDPNNQIKKVIKYSGNITYRVWFKDVIEKTVKDNVIVTAQELRGESEWSSDNLLAISLSSDKQAAFEEYLSSLIKTGLVFERG